MEKWNREMEKALKETEKEKREMRQASILKVHRERTKYVFSLWKRKDITDKELGNYIREGKADLNLIRAWKKEENMCCVLCTRKGRRCICRKVKGIECTNCRCIGECTEKPNWSN